MISLFTDIGSKLVVGCTSPYFDRRTTDIKHFAIGGILWNLFDASGYCICIPVNIDFFNIPLAPSARLVKLNRFFSLFFSGRAGLMTPFVYYHFLALRYSSRRNPYNRNTFHELRLATEALANNPKVPPFGKKILHSAIALVSRLAPAMAPVQH